MKTIINSLICCIFAIAPGWGFSQDGAQSQDSPKGTPIVRIFANVYSGLTDADPSRAFEVRRAYFGYKYRFDSHFSTEIKLDIGSPEEISEFARLRRYAYFKTAGLYWDKHKWSLKAGIIDTEHYRIQEKYWKHRYIYKSMQDEHRFGPKADLGATVVYRISRQIVLDASLMNGEGYTNLQQDNTFKTSFAVSCFPVPRVLLRVYYDFINQEAWQSTLSTFAGYSHGNFTGGAEYNRKGNKNFLQDHNQTGLSAYLSCQINDKFEVFGRYDRLSSNQPPEYNKPWNLPEDGSAIIAGVQFQPISHVKIALNYQDWVPYAANMENRSYLFLNLEVVL